MGQAFFIQSCNSSHLLDIRDRSSTPGAELTTQVHNIIGDKNQRWYFDEKTKLISSVLDPNLAIEYLIYSERVVVHLKHGGLTQQWKFEDNYIISCYNGLVLDVKNSDVPKNGFTLTLARKDESRNNTQKWKIVNATI